MIASIILYLVLKAAIDNNSKAEIGAGYPFLACVVDIVAWISLAIIFGRVC